MKKISSVYTPWQLFLPCLLLMLFTGSSVLGQTSGGIPAKTVDTMSVLLDLSRPTKYHQYLSAIAGNWNFQDARRSFVKGVVNRKPIYDGRFYIVEVTGGKLPLPVADGKMKEDNYQSMHIEGYDNARKLFVSTSLNNHIGSDIQFQTGSYDSTSKTFTYRWESELLPGNIIRNKRTLKIIDENHYTEEYYEQKNGQDKKVRELNYTRVQ